MKSSVTLEGLPPGPDIVPLTDSSGRSAHLNGCVPLSHQVAGHKYGVDKVGELVDSLISLQCSAPPEDHLRSPGCLENDPRAGLSDGVGPEDCVLHRFF